MAVVALRSKQTLRTDATGVLRRGYPEEAGPKSQFHLGSLTKAITATMLATLVDEGKLTWDTRPLDVFPEWRGSMMPDYSRVTVEDLLRHRAGLAAFTPIGAKEFQGFPSSETWVDCARWILQQPPARPPGTTAFYSNAGPCIAAVMAECITGLSWEQLLRERVFAPLGIQGGFGWPATSNSGQPWGHRPSWLGPQPVDPRSPYPLPDFFRPAGDTRMTLNDYGHFLGLHLSGLRGKDSFLRAATVQHLHTPVEGYGIGWGVGYLDGVLNSGHVGGAGSFLAVASIWPTKDLAAAVAVNLDSPAALEACNSVLTDIYMRLAS